MLIPPSPQTERRALESLLLLQSEGEANRHPQEPGWGDCRFQTVPQDLLKHQGNPFRPDAVCPGRARNQLLGSLDPVSFPYEWAEGEEGGSTPGKDFDWQSGPSSFFSAWP